MACHGAFSVRIGLELGDGSALGLWFCFVLFGFFGPYYYEPYFNMCPKVVHGLK